MEVRGSRMQVKSSSGSFLENVPFQPMRPRDAPIRMNIESRRKLESRFRAKISPLSKQASSIGFTINPEKERVIREEKEEWMLDLQEIYDKIHEELAKLIKTQSHPTTAKLSSEQASKFKDLLDRQMAETESMMGRLMAPEKKSLQSTREGVLIAKQFRSSLKDLYQLMESVAAIQLQKEFANSFEFTRKLRQLRSRQLIKEIANSTQRKDKVRLGNSLNAVVDRQKLAYEEQKVVERQKMVEDYNKLRTKYPYDEDIQLKEPKFFSTTEHHKSEIERFVKQRNDELAAPSSVQDPLTEFKHKKHTLEMLADKMIHIDGPNVDFDQKYKNIGLYFSERRSLNNLYLGEQRLASFLADFEKKCADVDTRRRRMHSQEDDQSSRGSAHSFMKDIDKDQDPAAAQLLLPETSGREGQTTQNKVAKINAEIESKLLEEEHGEKMQQIKRLGVEQNQNYWDQILQRSSAKGFTHLQPIDPRLKKKAQTSHGPRKREGQNLSSDEHGKGQISVQENDNGMYLTEVAVAGKTQSLRALRSLGSRAGLMSSCDSRSGGGSATAAVSQQVKMQKQRELWLEKSRRLVLNAHPNNQILAVAFSHNQHSKVNCAANFATEPVTDNQFLVRRRKEHAHTSHVGKRSDLQINYMRPPMSQGGMRNLNQVKEGDSAFRDTFFSNFVMFQPEGEQSSMFNLKTETEKSDEKKNYSETNNWTIKYPSTSHTAKRPSRKAFIV